MNFAVSSNHFHVWFHLFRREHLQEALLYVKEHPDKRAYLLSHFPYEAEVPPSERIDTAYLRPSTAAFSPVPQATSLDIVHNIQQGPVNLSDPLPPHQLRLILPSQPSERAYMRFFYGSSFSSSLWRVIPSDRHLTPLSRADDRFLMCTTYCQNCTLLGLEDGLKGSDIGDEFFAASQTS